MADSTDKRTSDAWITPMRSPYERLKLAMQFWQVSWGRAER